MRRPLRTGLFVVLLSCAAVAEPPGAHAQPAAPSRLPVCMIVDDPAPLVNTRAVEDNMVCKEIPTSFYREFGLWAQRMGVKGKWTIVPCVGGVAAIDGSLGEFPGHTAQERLDWIEMIKTLYEPRFTITPEVITHGVAWDVAAKRLMAGRPRENDWLAEQPIDVQIRYVTAAMQMLKNAGITIGGLTMCWHYPEEKNHVLGEVALRAAEKVYGLKYVMVFNDGGDKPGVIYRRDDGAMAVSLRPSIRDVYDHTFGKMTEADVQRDADSYITADGSRGKFVDRIKAGKCIIFYTHAQTLYGNGTKSGFKVFQIAVDRLEKHYGDRIQWMTGLEACQHYCPPEQEPKK